MVAVIMIRILVIIMIVYIVTEIIEEVRYYRSVNWDFSRDYHLVHRFIRLMSDYHGIAVGLVKLLILASVLIVLIAVLKDVGGQLMGSLVEDDAFR